MRASLILSLLTASIANSSPVSPITTVKDVDQIKLPTTLEYIILPDNFDMNHPALNISNLLELLESGTPLSQLPKLPKTLHVSSTQFVYESPSSPSFRPDNGDNESPNQGKARMVCEPSSSSPAQGAIRGNGEKLKSLGSQWCCTKGGKPGHPRCKNMRNHVWFGHVAATDICSTQNACIRCEDAGMSNLWIALNCPYNVWQAGGYIRWDGVTDVNAYKPK